MAQTTVRTADMQFYRAERSPRHRMTGSGLALRGVSLARYSSKTRLTNVAHEPRGHAGHMRILSFLL